MDLPPQPPPDVPAPPPGPEAIRSRRIMKNIFLLGTVSIALLILLFIPTFYTPPPAPRTVAISNIRQIGLTLFAFDDQYGRFPDASTIPAVQAATGTTLHLGDSSSNQLFRQLLATVGTSELIFWAKTPATRKKPDDILAAGALAPGECAYSYVAGLTSSGDPETPIVMTPMIRGTLKFDPKPFGGKAIVLNLDSSATALTIEENGDVLLNGMNLFDPRQPFWRGKAPDIKWPE
jgi:hypothetical protein